MEFSKEEQEKLQGLRNKIVTDGTFPDFPKPGILFRDVFAITRDPESHRTLNEIFDYYSKKAIERGIQAVVAIDARGFLFGPVLALKIGVPFVPVRKRGKLPGNVRSVAYSLEYGEAVMEIQEGSIQQGFKVLVVDDLLATGGSLRAACELITKSGGVVHECLVVLELLDLKGRNLISAPVTSLLQF
ncbi:hypothetical protein J437_LFUL004695 [Ladona fulva]|uniref:Adenine phosphoribosyltransferase n=1 Tax=Ladona fulva TaxID=123851 RepID=A0A8K0KSL9_LADFU|nr:hypothetical protein J437_LFUL004695 [Ladona fulva]